MEFLDVLQKKRDNKILSKEEIDYVVKGTVNNSIPDYQLSAFLMAIYINGMTDRETYDLTMSMVNNGNVEFIPEISEVSVDKHSTGGVGDKLTLVIAPLLSACGIPVVKMSGRGLGITGGTLDKLESIPGFKIDLSEDEIEKQAKSIGIVLGAQTKKLAPADKKFYELRDVTATIDSLPLIASSIMSKKLAIKNKALCIDLKVGKGAFMKDLDSAEELAKIFKFIAEENGRDIRVILTNMDYPIGRCVGNSLEIYEAIQVLKGELKEDVYQMSIKFAVESIKLLHSDYNINDIERKCIEKIEDGSAYYKFKEMVKAQNGDLSFLEEVLDHLSSNSFDIYADLDGIVKYDAFKIGYLSLMCGAGRKRKEDCIDHGAGIKFISLNGDQVKKGDKLFTVYTNKQYDEISNYIKDSYEISDTKAKNNRIIKVI